MVAVEQRAEIRHTTNPADTPAGTGLFESSADHVFAGSFDLAAADLAPLGQALGITQNAPEFAPSNRPAPRGFGEAP